MMRRERERERKGGREGGKERERERERIEGAEHSHTKNLLATLSWWAPASSLWAEAPCGHVLERLVVTIVRVG
jgi:hypothetical protein